MMQYRKFGKYPLKVSALGFGTMRLPVINGDNRNIDENKAIDLIRSSIDKGINYIDTAYPYHGGNSEVIVGKALKDGYREKAILATKMPVWLIEKEEDFEKYLKEQLLKLNTNHIDVYLLHALNKERFNKLKELNVFKYLDKWKREGIIKYCGFSFHDQYEVFKEIIDFYDFDMCQIQYNYLDTEYQAGLKGLKYAKEKNLAVVIMEPLRGGSLAKNPPAKVESILRKVGKTPAEIALSFIYNHEEVTSVLSGMNDKTQVDENIITASKVLPGSLSKEEIKSIEEIKKVYMELMKVNCTSCEYCMPCPHGVNIPMNFTLYNEYGMFNKYEECKKMYSHMKEKMRASSCLKCGKCEKACPQHLPIRELLEEVNNNLKE